MKNVATDALSNKIAMNSKITQILSFIADIFNIGRVVVSVVNLYGVLGKVGIKGGLNLDALNKQLEDAFKPKNLAAVCLCINSPGGSPVQSELIAARIIQLSQKNQVPVYAFVEDMAASGGYWLACAADEIYASKSSIIGSIGVVSASFGFVDTMNKLGVERRVYTQGQNKMVLDPFQPTKSEDVKIIGNLQKQVHQHFIDHVKKRRKNRLTQSDDLLFNGEFWSGLTAKDFGLIDGIENLYEFIDKKYGSKVKINIIGVKEPWLKKKLGISLAAEDYVNSLEERIEQKILTDRFRLM